MGIITKEQTKGAMWVAFGLLLFHALIVCLTDFGGTGLFFIITFAVLIANVRTADPDRPPISILSNNKFFRGHSSF